VIAGFAESLTIALLLGLLAAGWRRWPAAAQRRLLAGSLAVGLGLGISSGLFIMWSSATGSPASYPVAEFVFVAVLAGLAFAARGRGSPKAGPTLVGDSGPYGVVLRIALGLCAVGAAIAFVAEASANPHGGWDAWMTWNMHARAIVRGAEGWREMLGALPDWSHPDYPLLIPASVARVWTYQGRESAGGAAAVGFLFTFATVGLLYAAVSALRSPTQGALAALMLVTTKFFVLQGASQYADIPLSFFFLATLALLTLAEAWPTCRPRLLLLAGLTAGLAAWTKNEGLLFIPVVVAVYFLTRMDRPDVARDARAAVIGLAPVVILVVAFKFWIAAPNDLLADQGLAQIAARVLEVDRYRQILGGFVHAVLEVSAQGVVPVLLAGYVLAAGVAPGAAERRAARMAAMVVGLMLVGYAAVLLVAPAPRLGTNIRSINRLLLQLWPSMLLAYFCLVRTVEEARLSAGRNRTSPEPA
jgi:hypothetical protein